MKYAWLVILTVLQCTTIFLFGQDKIISGQVTTDFDRKLSAAAQPLSYYATELKTIKIPKRKHDSPFFCNELIPFKKGFIINSLTTSPGGGSIDIRYSFYYIDMPATKIYEIKTALLDTIESVITQDDKIYLSGRKRNSPTVIRIENNAATVLPAIADGDFMQPAYFSWVKLGIYKNNLLALKKSGVYTFENNQWVKISSVSIDGYYLQNGYKRSHALIPTENIRIHGNKLYFLQELTQQRDCNLFYFDLLKDTGTYELWQHNQLTDNTQKEINSYEPVADGVWVAGYRLMNQALLLKTNDNTYSSYILNNLIANENNKQYGHFIKVSCIKKMANDSLLLVAENGLFYLHRDVIVPVLLFSNEPQEIKDGGVAHFEFVPRCVSQAAPNQFLIGGLWGGLYLLDIGRKTIACLDDLKNEPPVADVFAADFQ